MRGAAVASLVPRRKRSYHSAIASYRRDAESAVLAPARWRSSHAKVAKTKPRHCCRGGSIPGKAICSFWSGWFFGCDRQREVGRVGRWSIPVYHRHLVGTRREGIRAGLRMDPRPARIKREVSELRRAVGLEEVQTHIFGTGPIRRGCQGGRIRDGNGVQTRFNSAELRRRGIVEGPAVEEYRAPANRLNCDRRSGGRGPRTPKRSHRTNCYGLVGREAEQHTRSKVDGDAVHRDRTTRSRWEEHADVRAIWRR